MKIAAFGTMWNEEVMRYYYDGLNQWAKETGGIVDLFVCYGNPNMDNPYNMGEYAIYDYPDFAEYDGAIMIASNINEKTVRESLEKRIRESELPCVVMDHEIEGFSRIYIDQEYYIRQIVKHLVEKHGAKKLCYIGGLASNVEGSARRAGFYNGMKESGLYIRNDWVFEKSFLYNDGYDVMKKLLCNRDDLPDAIVCANDDMAGGVCEALHEAGIEVGKDCMVTGFDQYFMGENFSPSLTTVARPRESIAYNACKMLEKYEGVMAKKERAKLFWGQSCGCGASHNKNDEEFRREVFNTFNNRDMLSSMLEQMEENMITRASISAMMRGMEDVFGRFKEGRCRIYLQPDIEERPKSVYNTYRTCTKEYTLWQEEKHVGDVHGHAYIYVPIHFLDHLYGYCVLRDVPQLMRNKELYNFTKSIGFSMENMVQKKKYAAVNNKLQVLYETDYLTGAYNRHGIAKYANEMLCNARANGKQLQVIFVDIDGLKSINDQFGHEAGDVVIQIVGHAACEIADDNTKVFRYGGDEFLVLHEGEGEFDIFCGLVEKAVEKRSKEMCLPYKVSASIGHVIAVPGEQKTLEEYVKDADHIMYTIKQERHKKQV